MKRTQEQNVRVYGKIRSEGGRGFDLKGREMLVG